MSQGMSNVSTTDIASPGEAESSSRTQIGMGAILLPVLLSTVLTLGCVGGAGYYLVRTGKLAGSSQAALATTQAAPVVVVAPPTSHVLAMEPMIVNLSDVGGHAYLRATLSLRIQDELQPEKKEEKKDAKAVDGVATELRDTTLTVLSRKTSDELLQQDGRELLKKSLEQEYKQRNVGVPVLDVYFTDFLVQRG